MGRSKVEENYTQMSDHQYHLAVAAGFAKTLPEMEAAWAALGPKPHPDALSVVIVNAIGVEDSTLVPFLDRHVKLSDLGIVEDVWTRVAQSYYKEMIKQLTGSAQFQELVRTDKTGKLLMACMGVRFEGMMAKLLGQVAKMGPPQRALDLCLAHVVQEAPDKSFRDGWDKAFEVLMAHGASPFSQMEKQVDEGWVISYNSVLFALAKEAKRLRHDGTPYLESLLRHHPAAAILGQVDEKRSFVGMWNGGQGDRRALVDALKKCDEQGGNWRDGDPFAAFSDALRFGCRNPTDELFVALCELPQQPLRHPVESARIPAIVDQAFRVSMQAQSNDDGDLDDIFAELLNKKKSGSDMERSYAAHRAFWGDCASSLGHLFKEPGVWRQACEHIQVSLTRTAKPTSEETSACLTGLVLVCKTATPADRRRPSSRL